MGDRTWKLSMSLEKIGYSFFVVGQVYHGDATHEAGVVFREIETTNSNEYDFSPDVEARGSALGEKTVWSRDWVSFYTSGFAHGWNAAHLTMFAPRFDPNAPPQVEHRVNRLFSRKRKLVSRDSDGLSDSESEAGPSAGIGQSDVPSERKRPGGKKRLSGSGNESDSGSDIESDNGSESESDIESDIESDNTNQNVDSSTDDGHDRTYLSNQTTPSNFENAIIKNDSNMDVDDEAPDSNFNAKHSRILEKFNKSVSVHERPYSDSESDDSVEVKDLAPLPQPELPRDRRLMSNKSHQNNLDWLATPTYSSPEISESFSSFGLSSSMLANLSSMGFEKAFSVQVAVLREMMQDIRFNKLAPDFQGDILVNASTGSGKTLAYSIPIVEALSNRIVPRVRAIILVPTKPLINQVSSTLRSLSKGTVLTVVNLTNDLSIREEADKISKNIPDILVTTPGRLVDHIINESISMEALRFLVIDEADRLLNQSFQNWCEVVISSIEKWSDPSQTIANSWQLQPQKMIFSATLTTDAGKLALLKFKKPRIIIVNSKEQLVNEMFSVPPTLHEYKLKFASSKSAMKPLLLAKFLLHTRKLSSVLVFAQSNDATLRLAHILTEIFLKLSPDEKVNVAYMNSTNNTSSVRKKILREFDDGVVNVLVATDLMARGIDILSIKDVVNYDLPNSSREYVHRVGRTARANKHGEAFTMCFGKGEEKWFSKIMRDVSRTHSMVDIGEEPVSSHEKEMYSDVMKKFQDSIKR